MESPIKKKSFVSKVFRVFTAYIFVTLAVFFGYIQIFGGVKNIYGTLPTGGADGEVDTTFSDFVANMMSMESVYVEGVSLEFESSDKATNISLVADVAFDKENLQMSVDADLVYNNNTYDVGVVYSNSNIYLSLDDSTYKFEAEQNISGFQTFDFSSVLGLVSQFIDIDLSGLDKIQEAIGIDFSNLDMGSLINSLEIATKKIDGGSVISIGFKNIIQATIYCDQNSNMTSASLNDIKISGNVLKLSVPTVVLNDEEIEQKIDVPDEDQVVDLSGVLDYASGAQNLLQNDFVEADVEISVAGKTLDAKLYYDNAESLKVKLETEYRGLQISLTYASEKIYFKVGGLGLSFNVEDYAKWRDKIEQIVECQSSKTVSELAKELLDKFVDSNAVDFDFETEIRDIILDFTSSSTNLKKLLPDEVVESENEIALLWTNGLSVTLGRDGQTLSTVAAVYEDISLNVTFRVTDCGIDVNGQFYDLTKLLPLLDVANSVATAGKFAGSAAVSYNENEINFDYVIDLTDGLVASFSTEIFSEKVSIFVDGEKIFAQIGGVVIEGNVNEIEDYVARIEKIFGLEINTNIETPEISNSQIFDSIKEIFDQLKVGSSEEKLAIIEYLAHKFDVAAENAIAQFDYAYKNLCVTFTLGATDEEIVVPTATDSTLETLDKIENLKNFAESSTFAFDVAFAIDGENVSGTIFVDLENLTLAVENLSYKNLTANFYYKDKVLYAQIGENKVKVKIENAESLVAIISSIVAANGIELDENTFDLAKISEEIFGEDVMSLSIEEILQKLAISLSGSFGDLNVDASLNTAKVFGVDMALKFDGDNLKSIEIELLGSVLNIEIVDYAEFEIDESVYYDLISAQSGTVTFRYGSREITAKFELDLNGRIYAKLSTSVFGLNASVMILDNMFYMNIGDLNYSTDFNNLSKLYAYAVDLFDIAIGQSAEEFDANKMLSELEQFDMSKLDMLIEGTVASVTYSSGNLEIELNLNSDVELDEVAAPQTAEDIQTVLPKIKNLVDYIRKGVFEFDFDASYNGLEFAGTFKYADGVLEIADVVAAGEVANIRIENGKVYFSYGNMKLKFDVPENDGSVESESLKSTIEQALSDELGVTVQFGVFEEILNIISSYSESDYATKILLALGGNSDELGLTISNKKKLSYSQILSANVKFEEDMLSSADVSIYDILSAKISINQVETSTIEPFDEDEFSDYSSDFVAGVLDSLEVVSDVYAFSSDVAIRYSTTTFYGEVVAMMVKDEGAEVSYGGYVPAITIHTTSLGLNSYIYLIGQTVYLDINGLQISADLTTTTIDEVLSFVENNFGLTLTSETSDVGTTDVSELAEATVGAFKVILPAIDKIYGSWLDDSEQGIQVKIDDSLWYSETSYFSDIILQAFISNYKDTIVPTKLIIGANIHDPNTLVYDDYSDYWLTDGSEVMEDSITKGLNFGAYFTNISVGKFAESVESVFGIEDKNFKNIHSVLSNYGMSELDEFNSYETVLTMAEAILDYGKSLEYQVSLNASLSDSTSSTSIGGDVVVQVRDPAEDETCELDLFDGKVLKVQGNLDIVSSGVEHLIDVLYANNSDGLYVSYTHGDEIANGNKFRAKIANTNMSDIIAMIVKFADLDLSDSMKEAWSIDYCTTDFSYVQSLLGMGQSEVGDEFSKADQALNSVESITKMLGLIKLSKEVGEDDLATITLSLNLNLSDDAAPATVKLVLVEEYDGEQIVTKLRKISVENLVFGGKTINATIDIQDFSESSFDYDTTASHIDFSEVSSFVDTVVSTLNTKNFNFNGSITVNIINVATIDINIDLLAQIDENNEIYVYAQLELDCGGVSGLAFDKTFDKRYITYEYKDDVLTYYRYSQTSETKMINIFSYKDWTKLIQDTTGSYASNEIIPNISTLIQDSFGFKSLTMETVQKVIDSIDVNPTVEQALLAFNTTETGYTLTISGENLLGSSSAKDIPFTIGKTTYSGWTYDDDGNEINKNYSFVDSITGLQIVIGSYVKIYADLYSNNDVENYTTSQYQLCSSYNEYTSSSGSYIGGYYMNTNRYYRNAYIATVGGLY